MRSIFAYIWFCVPLRKGAKCFQSLLTKCKLQVIKCSLGRCFWKTSLPCRFAPNNQLGVNKNCICVACIFGVLFWRYQVRIHHLEDLEHRCENVSSASWKLSCAASSSSRKSAMMPRWPSPIAWATGTNRTLPATNYKSWELYIKQMDIVYLRLPEFIMFSDVKKIIPAKIEKPSWQLYSVWWSFRGFPWCVFFLFHDTLGSVLWDKHGESARRFSWNNGSHFYRYGRRMQQKHCCKRATNAQQEARRSLPLVSRRTRRDGNMNPMLGKALLLTNINQMEYFKTRHKTSAIFFFPRWCTLGGYCKIAVHISCYWNASGQKLRPTLFILISEYICTYFNISL